MKTRPNRKTSFVPTAVGRSRRKSVAKVNPGFAKMIAVPGHGITRYGRLVGSIRDLLAEARRTAARAVNRLLVETYWEIGRRIVHYEQKGSARADYGEALLARLSMDLTVVLGRGFSRQNLQQMRLFYLAYPSPQKCQTVSGISDPLPLSWSHYTRLIALKNISARSFYESEAIRGGWSIRQLERQIDSQFYERTALSRNKAVMLRKGSQSKPGERSTPEEAIKDPYVLEFLNLKDEYAETDLEEALTQHLQTFLLELGSDFTFVARQKRLRVGNEWYRVDLVFFHRTLRCLILADLKLGRFSHADAGQMHMYLNYAKAHWTHPDENPPVGLILCAQKDESVAKYSLEDLPNKVLAAEYRTVLPEEQTIVQELNRTRVALLGRWPKAKKFQ